MSENWFINMHCHSQCSDLSGAAAISYYALIYTVPVIYTDEACWLWRVSIPSDKSFEMSPRYSKGNSLVVQCSAAVFHKWMWVTSGQSQGFCAKKKNQYKTKQFFITYRGKMNLASNVVVFFCWSHLTAPQVDGWCHSVSTGDLKVTFLGSHNPDDLKASLWFLWQHQRDVEFLWSTVLKGENPL